MNYDEACETTISQAQAKREIRLHSANWTEFLADVGDRPEYSGQEVLDWLGY